MSSITVFADVIAPNRIWRDGARGRQMRRNQRVEVGSGAMKINVGPQTKTKRQYQFGVVPMRASTWSTLEGLFEVTEAGAYGFLIRDPKDDRATDVTGRVTLVDAGTHTYQLAKDYTSVGSSRTKRRNITRPILAGFVLKISGTPTLSYTLDTTTGRIVIPADPLAANVTWSGLFYVPVHFANDEIDWELVRAASAIDRRLLAGPSVVLDEVIE